MKKYRIWFWLQMKRMIKKPAFVLFLICLPFLSAAVDRLGQGESVGTVIGITIEESRQDTEQDYEEWNQRLLTLLSEQEGILQFRTYENKERMLQDVKKGELECGVSLPGNLRQLVQTDAWQDAINIYKSSASGMTEIVKEKIAGAVFTLYSEETYVNYMEETEAFDNAEASGIDRAEIVSFAQSAYKTRLLDGSTFDFQYHGESYQPENLTEEEDVSGYGQERQQKGVGTGSLQPAGTFRLKGILAVCIFLSGMCGLLTDCQDRQEKRFVRIAPEWMTTMVNIWIPTIYTSAAALLSLYLTGQFDGHLGAMGKELCYLFFYQFLIVVYCSIMRVALRKQELVATAIPILTLAGMICCPVWIRLAVYLPVFRVLEKLFPMTYYLLL